MGWPHLGAKGFEVTAGTRDEAAESGDIGFKWLQTDHF